MRVKLPEAHFCIFCVVYFQQSEAKSTPKLYIHSAPSSCTNGLGSPIETGRRIPETHQWDLLLWWSEAGSGQIWNDCCHGDHSSGPKAAVDSQLMPIQTRFASLFIYFHFRLKREPSLGAQIASAILCPPSVCRQTAVCITLYLICYFYVCRYIISYNRWLYKWVYVYIYIIVFMFLNMSLILYN